MQNHIFYYHNKSSKSAQFTQFPLGAQNLRIVDSRRHSTHRCKFKHSRIISHNLLLWTPICQLRSIIYGSAVTYIHVWIYAPCSSFGYHRTGFVGWMQLWCREKDTAWSMQCIELYRGDPEGGAQRIPVKEKGRRFDETMKWIAFAGIFGTRNEVFEML